MELKENERIDDLAYKGLRIIQDKEGFCFGIDSILLSDYAKEIKKDAIVMDIGTGTGIISLLLCKKTELKKIYGVEVQEEVAEMAKRNVILNHLQDKMEIIHKNIKDIFDILKPNQIDAIVTNPPYKKWNTGIINEEKKKLISRHEVACTLEDIIRISYELLKSKGQFYMIHRTERLVDVLYLLRKYKLEPKKMRLIQSSFHKAPNLFLIKCVKEGGIELKLEAPLVIYDDKGNYTSEINKIYHKN